MLPQGRMAEGPAADEYREMKGVRNTARSAERAALAAETPDEAPPADWEPVVQLGAKLLAESTKDLEIASWLIEALAREAGFGGMTLGFELTHALVDRFWDTMYPTPDEEGIRTRVAPLTGLCGEDGVGTLIVPIGMIPILEDDEGMPLSTWNYQAATEVSAITDPDARQRRIDLGAHTVEDFQRFAMAADPTELFARIEEIEGCQRAYGALIDLLDDRCGVSDSPASTNIRRAIETSLECLQFLTKDITPPSDDVPAEVEAAGEEGAPQASAEGGAPAAPPPSISGEVHTREDAVKALMKVRDFFRKTEPHSPVSYSIDQALRRVQLPLPELLTELIPDAGARKAFMIRAGLPVPDSDSSGE